MTDKPHIELLKRLYSDNPEQLSYALRVEEQEQAATLIKTDRYPLSLTARLIITVLLPWFLLCRLLWRLKRV